MLVERHNARLPCLDGARIWHELHEMEAAALLYVITTELRDLARTRTRIRAEPRHPPLSSVQRCLGVLDGQCGFQDRACFFLGESHCLAAAEFPRNIHLDVNEWIFSDVLLLRAPTKHATR